MSNDFRTSLSAAVSVSTSASIGDTSGVPGELSLDRDRIRADLQKDLQACRQLTLKLFGQLDLATLCHQAHPDFSPIGWHLGHIAMTESMWLLERADGQADCHPHWRRLLLADGLPKCDRVRLPSLAELLVYMANVRERTLEYLERAPLETEARLWYFILQHECQHAETAALVLQLQRSPADAFQPITSGVPVATPMVEIPAGVCRLGCDRPFAMDNERSPHNRTLDRFWIDRHPVTQHQFSVFVQSGGYTRPEFWSEEGWAWLQSHPVSGPRYWRVGDNGDRLPVCGR